MENFKHIPHEDELDGNAFYIVSDPSSVGGIAPDMRRYAPDPLAMRAMSKSELDEPELRNAPLMLNQWIQSNEGMRNTHNPTSEYRIDLMYEEVHELILNNRPRSHFQPAVKVEKDARSKCLKVGDVIAFLFLAFGFGLMLMYFGAFKVIGAVIHEAMR